MTTMKSSGVAVTAAMVLLSISVLAQPTYGYGLELHDDILSSLPISPSGSSTTAAVMSAVDKTKELLAINNFTKGVITITEALPPFVSPSPSQTPVLREAYGMLNNLCETPMPQTGARFPIGSNSKLFTAVALYQLQEQGKVNLTDNIANYLSPEDLTYFQYPGGSKYCPRVANGTYSSSPDDCEVITFVQLLDMTSNIPNLPDWLQTTSYSGSFQFPIDTFLQAELLAKPGSAYYYSNTAFILAGFFVQKISGMTYKSYLEENIFKPMGLTNTYYPRNNGMFYQDPMRVQETNTFMDFNDNSSVLSTGTCMGADYGPGTINAAGGLISTQEDVAKWWFALFNFTVDPTNSSFRTGTESLGGGILKPESVLEILKPRSPTGGGWYYGQGISVLVTAANQTVPVLIQYEGGLRCSTTANLLFVQSGQLIQLWTANNNFYPTQEQFTEDQKDHGTQSAGWFCDIVQGWVKSMDPSQMTVYIWQWLLDIKVKPPAAGSGPRGCIGGY